jgi:hypothetical protein
VVSATGDVNRAELRRYLARIGDRWPIEVAWLGGARVADERGAPAQRERGPEFVIVLVSSAWAGVPWLERVYHAASLWDALEMGAPADLHCYTPEEYRRRVAGMPRVREVAWRGVDLLALPSA